MSLYPETISLLIEDQARHQPNAIYALSCQTGQAISFGELSRDCQSVIAWLRAIGSSPGDVVSVVMPNGLQTLRLLLGAMSGGWCVNPVNLLSQQAQMAYVLAHSDCRVVFVTPEYEAIVRASLENLDREVTVVVTDADASSVNAPAALRRIETIVPGGVPANSMALLMYTSGTTGKPKGVMLSQANLVANAFAITREHSLTRRDRVLAVLPLYHINAFVVTMLTPLAHGGSLAITSKFSSARFWDQASGHACTWINVVPTIVSYLLEGPVPEQDTSKIRFCRSASAALPPEHLLAFEKRFGIGVIETMGLTETAAPSFSNPLERERRKVGAVGRASGCEARIVDASLRPVSDGQTGEIVIRGPQVMTGYYKNQEATEAAFTPDGWLRTGDLGHRDSDGFFFVTGRIKELIIKGGENIAPREIDEALLKHPAVLDAAVVAVPDKHYGQEILACVVARPGMACNESDLLVHCVQAVGRYKTPRYFRFIPELPRGPSGKVQRLKLLDLVNW